MSAKNSFSGGTARRPSLNISGSSPSSRRGSGNLMMTTGLTVAVHTRTNIDGDVPHAKPKTMSDHLRKYEGLFKLSAQRMRMIVSAFEESLEIGLEKYGETVPMIPTYVFGWPSGQETGEYLAVDLGGTNFRVCLITLHGGGKYEITQSKYRLTEEQKQEDGKDLFDFCARCVAEFIEVHTGERDGHIKPGQEVPLGFTFSYPCSQKRIDHGELIRWTKGFGNPNVEGHDAAEMFRVALAKYECPVNLVAIINDTTGTLIASHYVNPRTRIGVILGTGCNAAYMEKVKNVPKIKDLGILEEDPEATMAINCEWGAFDSFNHQHLPRTRYDKQVDEDSNKPGEQAFEKLISGRYLGEIMRLIICELIDEGAFFLGQNTYKIETPYSFDTAFLSLMETDPTDEMLTIVGIFTYFFNIETTLEERLFFKSLANLIGTRAARLSACGIAALISKIGTLEEGCAVAADGSLYAKYPKFADRLREGLRDIFGEKAEGITTHHAEDGSGVGSAIIAAMTQKRREAGKFNHV